MCWLASCLGYSTISRGQRNEDSQRSFAVVRNVTPKQPFDDDDVFQHTKKDLHSSKEFVTLAS
jgi:hypothetical protein